MPTPQPSLRDRSVIVTGGGRGLGREMALALVEAGARVAITGSRMDGMEATRAAAGPLADRILPVLADVRDASACAAAVETVTAAHGAPLVLVNNAGVGMRLISESFTHTPTRFWEADPAAWATILDVNVNGAFNMARAVVPGMLAAGFGRIVNISTSDRTMVRRGYSPYGPSKAALEAASRIWAEDLAGTGVTVTVYLPGGASDTDLLPDRPDKRGADGNLLPPDIVRRGIRWLASDASAGANGGRFIARLWDETLPDDEAAEKARDPGIAVPAIMGPRSAAGRSRTDPRSATVPAPTHSPAASL